LTTEPVATATLSFDQRHRRRVRMLDDAGEPFLLDLERPVTLAAPTCCAA
jgi:urease accessory protein